MLISRWGGLLTPPRRCSLLQASGKCNSSAAHPCPVPFPDRCSFCLAGDCGIGTIPSAVDEIKAIYAHFAPLGRRGKTVTLSRSIALPSR